MSTAHPRPKDWRLDVVESVNYYRQIILRAMPDPDRWGYSLMLDRGYPLKQALACMEDAEDEGLIESGVSTRTAWLTDKGRQMMSGRPSR